MDPTSPTYMSEIPVLDRIFDENLNIIGEEPRYKIEKQTYKENTKIPYYIPENFPVCIRKNVSSYNKIFGKSDCEVIFKQQASADKIATKFIDKTLNAGSILTKPKNLNFNFTNGKQILEIESMEQIAMIKAIEMKFPTNTEMGTLNQLYYWAKSLLGISDSAQGKADSTALSGRAKEAQISRALGRQESKIKMKNTFYSEIYKMIFQYMLAYSDEPRSYSAKNEEGKNIEKVFNRYDFLERDKYGKWFYNDKFEFSVDVQSGVNNDRRYMLENIDSDLNAGLYGDRNDPKTMINIWKDRESLGYPNAKRQVARWENKLEEIEKINSNTNREGENINDMSTMQE